MCQIQLPLDLALAISIHRQRICSGVGIRLIVVMAVQSDALNMC